VVRRDQPKWTNEFCEVADPDLAVAESIAVTDEPYE